MLRKGAKYEKIYKLKNRIFDKNLHFRTKKSQILPLFLEISAKSQLPFGKKVKKVDFWRGGSDEYHAGYLERAQFFTNYYNIDGLDESTGYVRFQL